MKIGKLFTANFDENSLVNPFAYPLPELNLMRSTMLHLTKRLGFTKEYKYGQTAGYSTQGYFVKKIEN